MLHISFNPFPVLKTQRLTLRQLAITDDQHILTLRSNSEINKYLDRQASETIDDARNFINNINGYIKKNISVYWAITLSSDDSFAGTICLFDLSDENNKCEIGYELLPAFQGQGIMKEAAEKVIDYATGVMNIQLIEACTHKDNQNSTRLLEKLEFKKTANPFAENPNYIIYSLTK
ncbi:MAG: GNAT family N-acetyltransferase [Ferruginibacter sp.]|nr:GNAT family N-acetyltransferase [Ferruginibacter sp.]